MGKKLSHYLGLSKSERVLVFSEALHSTVAETNCDPSIVHINLIQSISGME